METNIIYYVQVNITCIIILFLLKNQLNKRSERFTKENILFKNLVDTTIFLCLFDLIAGIVRGKMYNTNQYLIQFSNIAFFISLAIVAYLWTMYVYTRLDLLTNKKKIVISIPLVLFILGAISNPWTNFLFSINKTYQRNFGTIIHWIIVWGYLLIPTIQTFWILLKEKRKQKKHELIQLLYFAIAPAVAGFIQMSFYGVTSTQVGITLSILIIFLEIQQSEIMTDSLTGLNNRHGFEYYLKNNFPFDTNFDTYILLLDLNGFKEINDKLGHITGDKALKNTSNALKIACSYHKGNIYLCRFGGDEFIILMYDIKPNEIEQLKIDIMVELETINAMVEHNYVIKTSIGMAHGLCSKIEDIEKIIHLADEDMYKNKNNLNKKSI